MKNFVAYNPTSVYFGKGVVNQLGEVVSKLGLKVLLIYGKGSIKKNGVYNDIQSQLKQINAKVWEYEGIKSNPIVEDVDAAAKMGIENQIDVIIAAGGGSVIDSAKIIAVCIANKSKGWDVMKNKITISGAIPLIGILTLAATGTEMNPVAVVQNHETEEKIGFGHPSMFPKHSFLDPQYTASVPANYTSYGIVDLIAHSLENYFGDGDATLTDRFVGAIIQEAIEYGPKLMNDLTNYEYRSKIMWAATNALNGVTGNGRVTGDWGVHGLGHVLSLLYDVPHGASLSIIYPAWLKFHLPLIPERIALLGKYVFNINSPEETITRFELLFKQLGSPVRLSELKIPNINNEEIIRVWIKNKAQGAYFKFKPEDYTTLLQAFE